MSGRVPVRLNGRKTACLSHLVVDLDTFPDNEVQYDQ